METRSKSKSKLKRRRDMNVNNAPRKSPRLASAASASLPKFTTKINDMNDDCLMHIFGYLDLRSLYNVAIANEWLRPAALAAYKRKFGKTLVSFNDCDEVRPSDADIKISPGSTSKWDEIYVIGLEKCLRYLRCFGPSITNLLINYNASKSARYNHVQQYVNDYCAESLTNLEFKYMPNFAPEQFQKQFVHVNEVVLYDGVLGKQWPSFVKCFPNLRRLFVEDVRVESRLVGEPFKLLEHVYVEGLRCNEGLKSIQIIADILNGAHELKSLSIIDADDCVPIDELLTMIKNCPSIANFEYILNEINAIQVVPKEVQRIAAECPALIKLWLPDHQFACVDAIALIRQLNSLGEFEFQMEKSEYADLMTYLDGDGGEWEVTVEDDHGFGDEHTCVTLKRQIR